MILRLLASFLLLATVSACDDDADKKAATPGEARSAPADGESANSVKPATDPRPVIVFLGDSLTAGLGLAANETMPSLIQDRLDEAGLSYRVINAGRSGDTTAGGLSRLSWYLRPDTELAAMIIGLGSNDAMRGLPLDEAEKNLTAIIEKTREAAPEAKIFLFQMEMFPSMGKEYVASYREIFPRVAEATGIELLPFPLEGVAANPELLQDDRVHPNAAGMKRVADNVWKALRPHL